MSNPQSQTTTVVGESQPVSRANSIKGPKAEFDKKGSYAGQSADTASLPSLVC